MSNIHREVEIIVDEEIEELANWNLFYNNTL
jgi:hypothetical protein